VLDGLLLEAVSLIGLRHGLAPANVSVDRAVADHWRNVKECASAAPVEPFVTLARDYEAEDLQSRQRADYQRSISCVYITW